MERFKAVGIVRTVLILLAVVVAVVFMISSRSLVKDMQLEEENKMNIFAQAYKVLGKTDGKTDLSLVLAVISSNKTIPVIIVDCNDSITGTLNVDIPARADTTAFLKQKIASMRAKGNAIRIDYQNKELGQEYYCDVCYDESVLISTLAVFPYIELAVMLVFVVIAVAALLGFKKSEQKSLWVGLSKETAHQLGTPISSMMAWTELLKSEYPGDEHIHEMSNDVKRLELIADRFSKIGSMPKREPNNIYSMLERVVFYMQKRSPGTIKYFLIAPPEPVIINSNISLLEWVIENLCKNAVDAMDGCGEITVTLVESNKTVFIDVSDTGKGIAKRNFKTVFQPGYTTKQRGWGLGLSLAKRIVKDYHKGKIYVRSSELGKGTTFRIELKNN
ncbi:MAG: HAMP domain-containing histidine kinase [Bacteroidaceae bacterium]|nr:HAMP domain-containing histidine kinase [Bacteroidaceae bacterium]